MSRERMEEGRKGVNGARERERKQGEKLGKGR